jgi:hypothetical protein
LKRVVALERVAATVIAKIKRQDVEARLAQGAAILAGGPPIRKKLMAKDDQTAPPGRGAAPIAALQRHAVLGAKTHRLGIRKRSPLLGNKERLLLENTRQLRQVPNVDVDRRRDGSQKQNARNNQQNERPGSQHAPSPTVPWLERRATPTRSTRSVGNAHPISNAPNVPCTILGDS